MTVRIRALSVNSLLSCALMLLSTAVRAEEVAGVNMPKTQNVAGETLQLNGVGVVKRMIVLKIYVVGLYLQTPTTDAQTAITKNEIKRIVINMRRDVPREKFIRALEDSFTRNSGPNMPALRSRLDRLEHAIPAIKKGDVLEFTYLANSETVMSCQGRELTIEGKEFADALLSIWLGSEPVNSDLKRTLLGQ
jgi:hypothetical protein